MKPKINVLFKYCACAFVLATIYPVIALLNGAFSLTGTIVQSICLIGFGLAVFVLRDILINISAKAFSTFFLPIFLIAGGCVAAFSFTLEKSLSMAALLGIIALLCGIFSFKMGGRYSDGILSNTVIVFVTVIDLIVGFITVAFSFEYNAWVTVAAYFFMCSIKFVSNNQNNLVTLTTNRHYSFSALPKKIRSFNLWIITGALAAIAVIFLIARNFKFILDWLGDMLLAAVSFITQLIFDLFNLGDAPKDEYGLQELPPMEENPFFGDKERASWLSDLIFYILKYLVLICVVAFILFFIYRIIRRWKIPHKAKAYTAEYTDSEQSVITEKIGRRNQSDSKRHWKREYFSYRKMKDGEEKFRRGYALAIRGLQLFGLPLSNSDTTCEIDEKSKAALEGQNYHRATSGYNFMAYGEKEYTQSAMTDLNSALEEISELKKAPPNTH